MAEPLAALNSGDRLDFMFEKQPRCPHCGHVNGVSANDLWDLYEEGEHEVGCCRCDQQFTVSTHVTYSFSTCYQGDEP